MLRKISAIFFSVGLTLLLTEVGFRVYRYYQLKNAEMENYLLVSSPLYQWDEKSGYRYIPNQKVEAYWLSESSQEIRRSHFTLNAKGQVTQLGNRPQNGAFRIAFLGDSLTACIHNDRPWPDTLERLLNNDAAIRKKLGRSVQVLNYARDGIGIIQFPSILKNEILPDHPDLIVTSFITADIYRKYTWRKTLRLPEATENYEIVLNCSKLPAELGNPDCLFAGVIVRSNTLDNSPATLQKIRKEIGTRLAEKIDWTSLYPDLLSLALGGKLETFLGRNPYRIGSMNIGDREESIRESARALGEIRRQFPASVFLLTPVYWEIVHQSISKLAGEVMERVPELGIVPMLPYLPPVKDRSEVNPWINYPTDMHFSNLGADLYAKAVYTHLRKVLLGTNLQRVL